MAQFKNTILGKVLNNGVIKGALGVVTGGVSNIALGAVNNVGKTGSKPAAKPAVKTVVIPPSVRAAVVSTPTVINRVPVKPNQIKESMFDKIKLFALENWKFIVPGIIIIPVAIWFFFFRNKRKTFSRR